MQALSQWLERNIPLSDTDASVTRISHGDFKCIFAYCKVVCVVQALAPTPLLGASGADVQEQWCTSDKAAGLTPGSQG